MKLVQCDVERVERLLNVTVRVDEDATAEDVNEALIIQAGLDWSRAEIVETYPSGPRRIFDEEAHQ